MHGTPSCICYVQLWFMGMGWNKALGGDNSCSFWLLLGGEVWNRKLSAAVIRSEHSLLANEHIASNKVCQHSWDLCQSAASLEKRSSQSLHSIEGVLEAHTNSSTRYCNRPNSIPSHRCHSLESILINLTDIMFKISKVSNSLLISSYLQYRLCCATTLDSRPLLRSSSAIK